MDEWKHFEAGMSNNPLYLNPVKQWVRTHNEWFATHDQVQWVNLQSSRVDDRWIWRLKRFPNLSEVEFNEYQLGPGLGVLSDLPYLKIADIRPWGLSCRIEHLALLPQLEEIGLGNLDGPVVGLERLRDCPNLRSIGIGWSSYGNFKCHEMIVQLKGFSHLEELIVFFEEPLDDALRVLKTMPRLKRFYIKGDPFTEDDLRQIAASRSIKDLTIEIDDFAKNWNHIPPWRHLQSMQQLSELSLYADMDHPDKVERELKLLLPNCNINLFKSRF